MEALNSNPFGYAAPIWQRFNAPARAGGFAPGTPGVVTGEAGTPAARSVLRLELKLSGHHVEEARFRAYGCPTSIAVGAWITEWVAGRSLDELSGLRAATLRQALEIPEDRAHCALMGEDALKAAVRAAVTSTRQS